MAFNARRDVTSTLVQRQLPIIGFADATDMLSCPGMTSRRRAERGSDFSMRDVVPAKPEAKILKVRGLYQIFTRASMNGFFDLTTTRSVWGYVPIISELQTCMPATQTVAAR